MTLVSGFTFAFVSEGLVLVTETFVNPLLVAMSPPVLAFVGTAFVPLLVAAPSLGGLAFVEVEFVDVVGWEFVSLGA